MKKKSVGLLELETAVLECFLEKKTPLSPLGVKLKFGGGNLFSPAMTSTIEVNNSIGSLLKSDI
jgi:hypothetical protein